MNPSMKNMSSSNHINDWNNSAFAYFKHTNLFKSHEKITKLLIASIQNQPNYILDFGCGPGNSTRILSKHFDQAKCIIGVDYSKEMINLARSDIRDDRVSFIQGNENFFSIQKDIYFDVVVFSNSFFHIEDKKKALLNLQKYLSKDAIIVFSMYESVFKSNLLSHWPFPSLASDNLFGDLLKNLSTKQSLEAQRSQDREIFDSTSLSKLFNDCGFSLKLDGIINLSRSPEERVSFFKIPAVSREVLPHINEELVSLALDKLTLAKYHHIERKVFSFFAKSNY